MTGVDTDVPSVVVPDDAFSRSPVGKARWRQRSGETLASALRRILIDEITSARAVIGDPDLERSEAIHMTRRCLKRVRSLWDVLDPLPGANRDGRVRQIRDAARLLAAARDADVMAAEARRLHERAEGRALQATERFLARCEQRARHAHLATPPFELVAARLRACEADARSLPTVFEGGRLLADSLVGAYRRGRRDWREIEDGAGGEALHDWRKRVKHRHHLSSIVPVVTVVTSRSIQTDLVQLGEFLGEEHDLAVMKARIEDDPDLLPVEDGREDLLELIARRRRKLAKIALELGSDLYALRTRAFERELEALRELC
ncbi:MAG: CHAD domain-containing protein [Phyllobacteriaceae bacterium]|nr:CHAD domain-containing protein [Phyllobacteriaceae bacterium]